MVARKRSTVVCCAFALATAVVQTAVAAGETRRIERAFNAWSSVCIETVATGSKRCSVEQRVAGPGGTALTWWLRAASGDGAEVTILSSPLLDKSVVVLMTGRSSLVIRRFECSNERCSGTAEVSAALLDDLKKESRAVVQMLYADAKGTVVELPTAGFTAAWNDARAEEGANALETSDATPVPSRRPKP